MSPNPLTVIFSELVNDFASPVVTPRQVDAPNDCGISFNDFQGMEVEDRVEAYLPHDESAVFESYGAQKSNA